MISEENSIHNTTKLRIYNINDKFKCIKMKEINDTRIEIEKIEIQKNFLVVFAVDDES